MKCIHIHFYFRIIYLRKEKKITYQYKVAGSEPRLSSAILVLRIVSQIRINVPFVLALANSVPCWLRAKQDISPWWAFSIIGAVELYISALETSWINNYSILLT